MNTPKITEYKITITETSVIINDKPHFFGCVLDKDDKIVDLNKKALLALADEMGYEPQFLFEEIADRLEEMIYEE